MEIIKNIGIMTACYLFGAIPFCYIIGKIKSGKKLTEIGDRNPGGWNLLFNVSKLRGILGIFLDIAKGYISYFIALRLSNIELMAILAGSLAVAGHNYSPYLKFKGGKGIATTIGLFLAIHPISIIAFAVGILSGLFLIRNMIWGVMLGILATSIFLYLFKSSPIYLVLAGLLLIIMVPKQINYTLKFFCNFKFYKEKELKDLFTPKIR